MTYILVQTHGCPEVISMSFESDAKLNEWTMDNWDRISFLKVIKDD